MDSKSHRDDEVGLAGTEDPSSHPTRRLRPAAPWWTSRANSRFRREQLEQYAVRVRPFLIIGAVLSPLGGLFDALVTHADLPLPVRGLALGVSLLLGAICATASIAFKRVSDPARRENIASVTDLLLTGLFALYLSARVVGIGGVYAHVTAAASLLAVLFVRTLVMPETWRRAALVGLAVWTTYPVAWLVQGWGSGVVPPMPDGTVAGSVALLFAVSIAISSIGAQMLLGLRRSQFQAAEARRYHIEKKLGGGGMGDIYLARHGTLKMPCALKVCRPPPGGVVDDMLRRFEKEARQVSHLKHPNVVRIFDYGEMEDGSVYYAMEHLPGMDLGEFLRREGPPPEERLLHWADQMLFALEEAHAQGIVHRDLKPANIFLTSLGGEPDVIKLLDFGLVKLIEERADGQERITRANTIPGTPLYMSPEQGQGLDSIDQRSDLYSLGVVLYELSCGRPPFTAAEPMNVLVQHVTAPPRPPRDFNPALSVETEAAVLRLLAKAPAERFADARSTHIALRQSPRHGAWDRERGLRWWAARPVVDGATGGPDDPTDTLEDDR